MKNLIKNAKWGIYFSGGLILIFTIILFGSLGVVYEVGGCGGGEIDEEKGAPMNVNEISIENNEEMKENADLNLKDLTTRVEDKIIPNRPKCKKAGPVGNIGASVPFERRDKCLYRTIRSIPCKYMKASGFSASSVQQAINKAANMGFRYVYLPKGFYDFGTTTVTVPSKITLYGDGNQTVIHTSYQPEATQFSLFQVEGDFVRITRMVLDGPNINFSLTNTNSIGILSENAQNLRVDHIEARGFGFAAIRFDDDSTGQVDHCYIHHNLNGIKGYGVAILDGSYVLIADNHFSQCRHMVASNGRLAEPEGEHAYNLPGRTPHWTVRRNLFSDDTLMGYAAKLGYAYHLWAIDAHPGMNGTCAIECNIIEKVRFGTGLGDGSCRITDNLFREPLNFNQYYEPKAIMIGNALDPQWEDEDNYVLSAMPHDFEISGNKYEGEWFEDVDVFNVNGTYYGVNISNNGTIIPETLVENSPPAPFIPILMEMGSNGVLKCYGSPACP